MATRKPSPKRSTKAKQIYFIELELNGTLFHGGGDTASEAIEAMVRDIPPEMQKFPKSKNVIRITKDGRVFEKYYYVAQLRRFFTNPLTRQLAAKTFTSALG